MRTTPSKKFRASEDETSKLIRQKKKQLEQLQKENTRSKEMIEKFIEAKSPFDKTYEQFSRAQEQLKQLSVKTNVESKKNAVLKELVGVMQEELVKNRKAEQLQSWVMRTNREKQRKKEQYDIEQVLQKHNQEVAKINVLREDVSAERSQRVVYSSLFKKLESEIKFYEQEFKDTLLVSLQLEGRRQQLLEKLHQRRRANVTTSSGDRSAREVSCFVRNSVKLTESQMQSLGMGETSLEPIFLTRVNDQQLVRTHHRNQSSFNSKRAKAQLNSQEVERYRVLFNKLLKETGFGDVEQLLEQLPLYEKDNEKLYSEIEQVNDQIYELELELKRGAVSAMPPPECQGERRSYSQDEDFLKQTVSLEEQRLVQWQTLLESVTDQLNVPYAPTNIEQTFFQLQNKIAKLSELAGTGGVQPTDTPMLHPRQTNADLCQLHIQTLLQKSQKYQYSEKIYTQDTFRQEYSRELGVGRSKKQRIRR